MAKGPEIGIQGGNSQDNARYQRNFTRWATTDDVKELMGSIEPSTDGRIPMGGYRVPGGTFGQDRLGLLLAEPGHSLLVVGETGTGKTEGITMMTLVRHQGPTVVTSARMDPVERTYDYRRRMSPDHTYVFAPMEGNTDSRIPRAKWSPLAYCQDWAGTLKTAEQLIKTSAMDKDDARDKTFWRMRGMKVVAPMLHAARIAGDMARDMGVPILTPEGQELSVEGTIGQVYEWNATRDFQGPYSVLTAERDLATGEYAVYDSLLKGKQPNEVNKDMIDAQDTLKAMVGEANRMGSLSESAASKAATLEEGAESLEQMKKNEEELAFLQKRAGGFTQRRQQLLHEARDLQYRVFGMSHALERLSGEKGMTKSEVAGLRESAKGRVLNAREALTQFTNIHGLPDDQQSSVFGVTDAMLAPYQYPEVRQATNGHDIDVEGMFDNAGCLYIVTQVGQQDKAKPLVDQMLAIVDGAANDRHVQGKTLKRPLIYLLDEAGNGSLDGLEMIVTTARDTGRQVMSAWQGIPQLVKHYGEQDSKIIQSGHRGLLVLAGTKDPETLEHLKTTVGDTLQETISHSQEKGDKGPADTKTESTAVESKPLITPTAIREGKKYTGVLVYGNLPPIPVEMVAAGEVYPNYAPYPPDKQPTVDSQQNGKKKGFFGMSK